MDKNVVLVSHGRLAAGVADAVQMVFGASAGLKAYGLAPDGNVVELIAGLRDEAAAHADAQYVVLADIYGGSVCNQCLQQLAELPNVKLVAGLSMALALGVLAVPGALDEAQLAQVIADAREGVREVAFVHADDPVDDGADDFF